MVLRCIEVEAKSLSGPRQFYHFSVRTGLRCKLSRQGQKDSLLSHTYLLIHFLFERIHTSCCKRSVDQAAKEYTCFYEHLVNDLTRLLYIAQITHGAKIIYSESALIGLYPVGVKQQLHFQKNPAF